MFRGSAGLSADQLADIGSIMGGEFQRQYQRRHDAISLHRPGSTDLDVALHIEALRMADVTDSQEGLGYQERGAIEQEVAEDISSPRYIMYQRLRTAMFAGTPYEHDALGSRPTFDKTSADMLKKFHDAWYAPNNAVLVVAGDVDPQATLAKIKNPVRRHPVQDVAGAVLLRLSADGHQAVQCGHGQPSRLANDRHASCRAGTARTSRPWKCCPMSFPAAASISMAWWRKARQSAPASRSTRCAKPVSPRPRFPWRPARSGSERKRHCAPFLPAWPENGVPADLVAAVKVPGTSLSSEFQKNSIPELASVWSDAVALDGLRSPTRIWRDRESDAGRRQSRGAQISRSRSAPSQ